MTDIPVIDGLSITHPRAGEGGSAIVHKAKIEPGNIYGLQEGTVVAVKEYKKGILEVKGQRSRIKEEAHLGSKIISDYVVRTHFLIETTNPDQYFLLMEWIDGQTLDHWINESRKNVSWPRIQQISLDIIDGVKALHEINVLHRDIKPENVMVVNDRAKIMDIGIAEITGNNAHTMHTALKDFIGTIRYASPQFVMGESFTEKDDVYSVGATLLQLFTGFAPYHETERKSVIPINISINPPRIQNFKDNIPAPMRILLTGCLHSDSKRRPSLMELREAIENHEGSSYIKSELIRQGKDRRGYEIIMLDSTDGGFFADTKGDALELYVEYTVVRREKKVKVPSLGTEIEPEMWIATAELRHLHQGVGHFKLIGKRWIEGELAKTQWHSRAPYEVTKRRKPLSWR